MTKKGDGLDARPFAHWLAGLILREFGGDVMVAAEFFGCNESRLRKLCTPAYPTVRLATVDRFITAWGDVDDLNRLYPLDGPALEWGPPPALPGRRVISDDDKTAMRRMRAEGKTFREIAYRFNVGASTACAACAGAPA